VLSPLQFVTTGPNRDYLQRTTQGGLHRRHTAVPEWSLAEVVTALQAMRGIDLIAAVAVLAELGDLTRFQNPRDTNALREKVYRPS